MDGLSRFSLTDPSAVCTDGSPASYYFRSAADIGSSYIWIFYLQGGGWCFDEESCATRCGSPNNPHIDSPYCSSHSYTDRRSFSGLLMANDPILRVANKIYLPYCTSDAHMGNAVDMDGWIFHGDAVVQAVLRAIVNQHGLGQDADDILLFGGEGTGANGAMIHLDYLYSMGLPSTVKVLGFLDSPLGLDQEPYLETVLSYSDQSSALSQHANVSHLGSSCAALFPSSSWKCILAQYRIPMLETPFFLVSSLYDSAQLLELVGETPGTESEMAYAEDFARSVQAFVFNLSVLDSTNGFFSWACYNSGVSLDSKGFNSRTAAGATMNDAFRSFLDLNTLFGNPSGSMSWIDSCGRFECGTGCHAPPNPGPETSPTTTWSNSSIMGAHSSPTLTFIFMGLSLLCCMGMLLYRRHISRRSLPGAASGDPVFVELSNADLLEDIDLAAKEGLDDEGNWVDPDDVEWVQS